MKKTLVIRSDPDRRAWWKKTFQTLLPEIDIVLLDEDEYKAECVAYAVVWNPPLGMFERFPNLECVVSIGAGVSHILKDSGYPQHVPIIRTVGMPLQTRMAEYVALHVLRYHRQLEDIREAHNKKQWIQYLTPLAHERTVGFMGLGNLGLFAARKVASLGFSVRGLTRTGTPVDGITVFRGSEIESFLAETDILVSILPETARTKNILNSFVFQALPKGSYLINAGRGENLVDVDLISALESGQLQGATLDVFREEPLPKESPFWNHPKILVTCHTAAAIDPRVGGEIIANNLRDFINGKDVRDVVNIAQGY